MIDDIGILWKPTGFSMPSLGTYALADVSDGDTPNIRMPVRMLSVDTPEVTANSHASARNVDAQFQQLGTWIRNGTAPVSQRFGNYLLPKLEGKAGTRHFDQGKEASLWFKGRIEKRLARPSGRRRRLFIRTADSPFDAHGRLLAYVAPNYSKKDLRTMSRRERATFNLDLVESGHAAPFILFPSIPGELDLPLFLEAAVDAMDKRRGQYADCLHLTGYEYRMCEKLYRVAKKLADGKDVSAGDRIGWRSRYAFDLRDRVLYGPEDYMDVSPPYRIWLWPDDVQRAIGALNLTPSKRLTG